MGFYLSIISHIFIKISPYLFPIIDTDGGDKKKLKENYNNSIISKSKKIKIHS